MQNKLLWTLFGSACLVAILVVVHEYPIGTRKIINRISHYATAEDKTRGKKFVILDWSPLYFSLENGSPENLIIDNCLVTRDKSLLTKSDAVVIEVRRVPELDQLPQLREPWQRWVYFNTESPYYAILDYVGRYKMSDFTGRIAFNWTMTYRTDSDAPVKYGWAMKRRHNASEKIDSIVKHKSKLVAAMASNCHYVKNNRVKYIKEMQKHTRLDFYGKCGNLACPGHYSKKSCQKIGEYKFFVTFENSNCRDYISEKMWMQAFDNDAVPVVMGAYKEDYIKVAPPGSFIHVDDFESPKHLAEYLNQLDKNDTAYSKYHRWRQEYSYEYDFRLLNKNVQAWRSLCSALNERENETANWYKTITDFEDIEKDCYQNEWVKNH